MQIDTIKLERIVETAKQKAASHPSWLRAIEKAHTQLLENPYITPLGDHSLLIASASGSDIYISNGTCQCAAFKYGHRECWHRACVQLVKRYHEAERENAILIKRGGNVMKLDGWDL
jgi:hypothetical protein